MNARVALHTHYTSLTDPSVFHTTAARTTAADFFQIDADAEAEQAEAISLENRECIYVGCCLGFLAGASFVLMVMRVGGYL